MCSLCRCYVQLNKYIITKLTADVNIFYVYYTYLLKIFIVDITREHVIIALSFDNKRLKEKTMITPLFTTRPLDLDISLSDLFYSIDRIDRARSSQYITRDYQKITLEEPIGAAFCAEDLIYYPMLCQNLRKLKQLHYKTSIDFATLKAYKQKGLEAIINCLKDIDDNLLEARKEKAKLEASVNNLIYLYGQAKTAPIFCDAKPYFHRNSKTYRGYKTNTCRLTISGVHYWLNYHSARFDVMKPLYTMKEHDMLANYFEATKTHPDALPRNFKFDFLGGVLNTPIYAFRAKYDFRQKGKKYYINLWDNTTFTRIADVRDKAMIYTKKYILQLIKE
jgi:hypothetical protein